MFNVFYNDVNVWKHIHRYTIKQILFIYKEVFVFINLQAVSFNYISQFYKEKNII